MTPTRPAVVALGGGHGLPRRCRAALAAICRRRPHRDRHGRRQRRLVGRLRSEFGVLPPGDLRMALAALCGDDEWGETWARVLQHRFAGDGEMRGHVDRQPPDRRPLGAARRPRRRARLGRPTARRLGPGAADGADADRHRRPGARPDPADPDALTQVRGQVEVATTDGTIVAISLDPPDPPAVPRGSRRRYWPPTGSCSARARGSPR